MLGELGFKDNRWEILRNWVRILNDLEPKGEPQVLGEAMSIWGEVIRVGKEVLDDDKRAG
jgi:hypothetical protein